MTEYSLFGYGSLILPTSVVARFDQELRSQVLGKVEESDRDRLEVILEELTSDYAIEKWEESDIEVFPAKLHGFERYYSLEAENGNMLAAEETGEESFINGVVICTESEDEYSSIIDTEEGYSIQEIDSSRLESYIPKEELPQNVKILIADGDNPSINKNTSNQRNPHYHRFIEEGANLLAEKWFSNTEKQEGFKKQFMEDFRKTTYEIDNSGKWKQLSEKQ